MDTLSTNRQRNINAVIDQQRHVRLPCHFMNRLSYPYETCCLARFVPILHY